MKSIVAYLCILCFLVGLLSCGEKGEKLLLAGSGWSKIVIIDKKTQEIEWEYPLEKGWECNSASWTPDGNILFSYAKGVKLITMAGEELWNIPADAGSEFQTACVLDNGNYLVAECGHPAKLFEVSPHGDIVREVMYETGIEAPYAQFRHISMDLDENFLIPLFETEEVRVIDRDGNLLRSIKMPGNMFCVSRLDNGNYVGACGDSHCYVEFNLERGEIVRTVNSGDIEGVEFCFVAQLLPTTGGGMYICNWQGHDPDVASRHVPQLIEIDRQGKIVWKINDSRNFGMISSISVVK